MELEYYRHMNRRDNPGGSGSATGVFGQLIYIDAVAEVVIVKQSSHPKAESDVNEMDGPLIWHAIAEHLMQRSAA